MPETQNKKQAKFLIKELLAIFDILEEDEFDGELKQLMFDLQERLRD